MKISSHRHHTLRIAGTLLIVSLSAGGLLLADGGTFRLSPHGSPTTGVLRTSSYPRASCEQCHTSHNPTSPYPFGLFRENSNELCLSASEGGCHADQPAGASAGYPAQEADRMPQGSNDPGYFEYNAGGTRAPGLGNLVRWPGRQVWEDLEYSPHNSDPDMPIKDAFGNGSCDNCHAVHGSSTLHDMLDTTYLGIVGSQTSMAAENYQLCLSCHNQGGPNGMSDSARYIADYYNRSINPSARSGHGITTHSGYVDAGTRLPCYDCHNPHGSQGYGRRGANRYLISDQRPGWYGLTDIKTDTAQVRRFCFGCHPSSDGQAGGIVEGISLPPISSNIPAHAFADTTHCYDCHGRDYSSSTSNNVHNTTDSANTGFNTQNPGTGN